MKMPWPVVWDAFLTALAMQGVIVGAGHFISVVGRHVGATSVFVSALLGFIFGVWTNPTPALVSGLGGILVAGGSAAIGAGVMFFLGDVKAPTLVWVTLGSAAVGFVAAAIGSMVGRSVFGA